MAQTHKKPGVSVSREHAQEVHDWLMKKNLLDRLFRPVRTQSHVVFPVVTALLLSERKELGQLVKTAKKTTGFFLPSTTKKGTLKDALRDLLTPVELENLVSGFDTLGNIAIIEIPTELKRREKKIAQTVLQTNAGIQTVCKKLGAHRGKYRIEPVKIIAGKKNLVADYRESGCRFRIHLGKTFFSPRLGFERLRIAKLIQPKETVGVFFAGVGPFPIIFAKHSSMQKAFAIELNPNSVSDLKFNIKLNKMDGKIVSLQGDVKKMVPKKFKGFFDRVVMPLPKGGQNFLKEALVSLKPGGGMVHFYGFVPKENPFEEIEEKIRGVAKKNGFLVRIVAHKQVRSFSKGLIQVVIDFWAKKQE